VAGLAVTPAADLTAALTAPATARRGQALTYTITIRDAGPSQAWQAALTDHLAARWSGRACSYVSDRSLSLIRTGLALNSRC
jgi:uncharacterized repeat protein (TIGR01451 family)